MSKVAVIAKITTVSGQRDEVVEILRDVVRGADAEPGTLVYAMNIDKADADVIWFYELYTDDAAFAAHGKGSEAMKAAGAAPRRQDRGPTGDHGPRAGRGEGPAGLSASGAWLMPWRSPGARRAVRPAAPATPRRTPRSARRRSARR